jgi:hypothetical protein
MIEFTEKQHVDLVIFAGHPSGDYDALFVVHTPEPGQPRQMEWRFRYTGRAEDGGDLRNWYRVVESPGGPSLLEEAERVAKEGLIFSHGIEALEWMTILRCDCNGVDAAHQIMEQPWARPMATTKDHGEA